MFKTLDDLDFTGRRVILRGDLNVPMRDGQVTDATRLDRLAPTISQLTEGGAKVIVVSHFGRPKGKVVPEMSLQPVAAALSLSLGGKPVGFATDCIGDIANKRMSIGRCPGNVVKPMRGTRKHGDCVS